MTSLGNVGDAVIVAVCVDEVCYAVAVCIDRRQTGAFVGVIQAIAVAINACWCDVSSSCLRFDVVGDTVAVAVEIEVIGNAVTIGIPLAARNGERFGDRIAEVGTCAGIHNHHAVQRDCIACCVAAGQAVPKVIKYSERVVTETSDRHVRDFDRVICCCVAGDQVA